MAYRVGLVGLSKEFIHNYFRRLYLTSESSYGIIAKYETGGIQPPVS